MKKLFTWLCVMTIFSFAGMFLGGWGPCGPNSYVSTICLVLFPVSAVTLFFVGILTVISEVLRKKKNGENNSPK
jgi:hypothetical protein